jgi:hypothetical protein
MLARLCCSLLQALLFNFFLAKVDQNLNNHFRWRSDLSANRLLFYVQTVCFPMMLISVAVPEIFFSDPGPRIRNPELRIRILEDN